MSTTWKKLIHNDVALAYAKERARRMSSIVVTNRLKEFRENAKSLSSVAVDQFMNSNTTITPENADDEG